MWPRARNRDWGRPVRFTKPALTPEQQAELLMSRGLQGERGDIIRRLNSVNYYRLSGYWYTFREPNDQFRAGTSIRIVWDHYVFDRKLRLLVMDAVERIEVAVRTRLSYELAHSFGPFGYVQDHQALSSASPFDRARHLDQIRDEVDRNKKEQFVDHFFRKYGDAHQDLPIWMAAEVLSFGTIVRLLNDSHPDIRRHVSLFFAVPDEVFLSWLRTLNFVRNVCAHHSRLWNRELPYRPKIPKANKYPEWHRPVVIDGGRVFSALSISRHCLRRIAAGSTWGQRLRQLLGEYPQISRRSMGFPNDWESSPIWKEAAGGN